MSATSQSPPASCRHGSDRRRSLRQKSRGTLPADGEAAHYRYDLIVLTFSTEIADSADRTVDSGARRDGVRSFQIGLAHGADKKLKTMKAERDPSLRRSTGRDLAPVKTAIMDEELEKLGLAFHVKAAARKRKVEPDAYEAGRTAGRKFEPWQGIEAADAA